MRKTDETLSMKLDNLGDKLLFSNNLSPSEFENIPLHKSMLYIDSLSKTASNGGANQPK